MQYDKQKDGSLVPLKQKNVDFGGGVERLVAVIQNLDDDYLNQEFLPLIKKIENTSGKKYADQTRSMRIIADHIRAATFILAERIVPKNVEQGYVLRRLIRRSIRHGKFLGIEKEFLSEVAKVVIDVHKKDYPYLEDNKDFILDELKKEELKFRKTLAKGLRKFNEISEEDYSLIELYGIRTKILANFLGKLGSNCWIEPPFYCDYGYNINLDNGVYMNFNYTLNEQD